MDVSARTERLRKIAAEYATVRRSCDDVEVQLHREVAEALRDQVPQIEIITSTGLSRESIRRIRIAEDIPAYPRGGFRRD